MSEGWSDYICGSEDLLHGLPLFPLIDGECPPLEEIETDRFRWLVRTYPDDPENLFKVWKDKTFLMDERRAMGNISLEDFYTHSVGLGVLLLRKEARNLLFLQALRNSLALRIEPGETVFFVGPTSGAEVEAIHAAGGKPILVSIEDDSKWQHLAEVRLFDSRVPFETFEPDRFEQNPYDTRHVVLSSWLPDVEYYVKLAYNSVGSYGFLYHVTTNLSMCHELQQLNLRRLDTFQKSIGVCLKYPKLQELHACS
jgi:hypothetical protein